MTTTNAPIPNREVATAQAPGSARGRVGGHTLTPRQAEALRVIVTHEGLNADTLAEVMDVGRGVAASYVRDLRARGYVYPPGYSLTDRRSRTGTLTNRQRMVYGSVCRLLAAGRVASRAAVVEATGLSPSNVGWLAHGLRDLGWLRGGPWELRATEAGVQAAEARGLRWAQG